MLKEDPPDWSEEGR